MFRDITIGSDPELFIWNKKTNKPVSSIGLIPGVKGDAFVPEGFNKGFGLQIDNVLAEFNIPPVKNKEDFLSSMNKMKSYIHDFVSSKNPDLTIKSSASEIFDDSELDSDEARLFGCSVDYNVYTEDANPKPMGESTNMRSAGFHVHVGYDNRKISDSLFLIKYLDMYLGVPSIILDTDERRRILYGKAGCFRLTDFGIEYRTLSGMFLKDDYHIGFIWDQMVKAIEAWRTGKPLLNAQSVERIINEADVDEAQKACKLFNIID